MTARRVVVHIDDETFPGAPVELLDAAVRAAVASEPRDDCEISVALLPDAEMARLNREFLGKDRTTDVLAFALTGGDETLVGDIYLGYEQAERQATELGIELREELARLAIHGTLHVLGHDHPDGPERLESPMFLVQERLLRELLEVVDSG